MINRSNCENKASPLLQKLSSPRNISYSIYLFILKKRRVIIANNNATVLSQKEEQ